jgi:RNA polymerase sigma-70 factor (ECF subfamily)
MSNDDDDEFMDLLKRAKRGDELAVREFLQRFEREVRTMVRCRLPKKLRNQFDSADFVQLVWASFFVDQDRESLEFDTVDHIRGFLSGMVRNKVLEQHRRLTKTSKYDLGREEPLYVRRGEREVVREVVSREPSPSQEFQADDRLAQLTAGRDPRDVEVLMLRRQGLTFTEIAERTGLHERKVRRVIECVRMSLESRRWQF